MADRRRRARSLLVESTSLATYESSTDDGYQTRVENALKLVIKAASSSCHSSVVQIDGDFLEECLSAIEWPSILRKETPLCILLRCLSKMWPDAAALPLARTMVDVLVGHGANLSSLAMSHRFLLDALESLVDRSPALQAHVMEILYRRPSQNRLSLNASLAQWRTLLSLLKRWAKRYPARQRGVYESMLDFLTYVDGHEMSQRSDDAPESVLEAPVHAYCRRCRQPTASVALVHGEASDEDEARLMKQLCRSNRLPRRNARPSMTDILQAIDTTTHNAYMDLDKFRSKCIRTVLLHGRNMGWIACRDVLIAAALRHLSSRSIRWCLLSLAAERDSSRRMADVLNRLWDDSFGSVAPKAHALSVYTEIIIESSVFDSAERLGKAVAPLLAAFRSVDGISGGATRSLLHCLATILVRRGNLLGACRDDLVDLLARLSIDFDQPAHWIDPSSPAVASRASMVQTLQSRGVLGVLCQDDFTSIPFAPMLPSVRALAQRLAPSLPVAGWLSTMSPHNGAPSQSVPKRRPSTAPLADWIHNDVLHHVFSFCGYKKLTQLRLVCREWKQAADQPMFWRDFYEKRYGLAWNDPLADCLQLDWRKQFMAKWLVERHSRNHARTQAGGRPRMCPHLGCFSMTTTPKQFDKHLATHRLPQSKRRRRGPTQRTAKRRQPC